MDPKQDLVQEIEKHVDAHGLLHVLTALELMCHEKADHIRTNWQDNATAKVWERDGQRIGRLLANIEN